MIEIIGNKSFLYFHISPSYCLLIVITAPFLNRFIYSVSLLFLYVRGIWTQKKEKNFATFVSFYYYVKAIMVVVVGLWDLFPTQFKNLYQLFLPPLLYHPNVNFSFYFLCCNKPQNNSLYFFLSLAKCS
jgi:hypothetical protein